MNEHSFINNVNNMKEPVRYRKQNQENIVSEQGVNSLPDLYAQWRKKRKIRAYSTNKKLVELKRKKIIDRASRAFKQKGVNGVTMEYVARLSGMCIGSIYRYFGSKEDLLFSFVGEFQNRLVSDVVGKLSEIKTMPPEDALKELIRSYMRAVDSSRDQVLILYLDARALSKADQEMIKQGDAIIVGLFEEAISRGIASGIFKTTNVKLCAQNIKALVDVWAVRGWALSELQTAEKYVEYQIEFLLGGLSAYVK